MARRAAFHTLGCKVNAYETEAMEEQLKQAGYEIVDFEDIADVYIINTCSVTNIADRKSRQMLHRAKKKNPDAVVVAAGCYVQASPEEAQRDSAVDLILGNNCKKELAFLLDAWFRGTAEDRVRRIAWEKEYEELEVSVVRERTRAYIKIQDGCNQFCSYCIIPYIRGRIRSRDQEEIREEAMRLLESGTKEIVLTGIHLSSYGRDQGREDALLELLRELHELKGLERIRLGSLEPRIITEEFVQALKKLPKVCDHFHLSLQSGCDQTLERMNRKYTAGEYLDKCRILRSHYENPAITTDVIVGFPGETEEEFETTRAFLEQVHFFEMHIFKYSRRKGTRADQMKDQILEPVKTLRSGQLLQLEERLSGEYRKAWIGRTVSVLFEETIEWNGSVYTIGHTPEYVKAAVPGAQRTNELQEVSIQALLTDEILLGELSGE